MPEEDPAGLVRIPCALNLPVDVDLFGIWQTTVKSELAQPTSIEVMVKAPNINDEQPR